MSPSPFWPNPFIAESSEKQRNRRAAVRSAIDTEYYDSRREAMKTLYRGGATLEEIGAVYGVTRERARQVIAKEARRGKGVDPIKAINVCRRARSFSKAVSELGIKPYSLREILVSLGYWKSLNRLWAWRKARYRKITDGQLIAALQTLAVKLGHTPSMNEANADPNTPCHTVYVTRFGNWAPACAVAGLKPSAVGYRGHKHPRGRGNKS